MNYTEVEREDNKKFIANVFFCLFVSLLAGSIIFHAIWLSPNRQDISKLEEKLEQLKVDLEQIREDNIRNMADIKQMIKDLKPKKKGWFR